MKSAIQLIVILATGIICCIAISSFSYIPGCNYSEGASTVDFRKFHFDSKFQEIKLVTTASFETLSKKESESGNIPLEDWIRLKNYLLSFKDRYSDIHSERLDRFIAITNSKIKETEQGAAANP